MFTLTNYKEVAIPVNSIDLKGNLRLADATKGIVVFSHGSGSSRMSPRNNYVAELLLKAGYSSLLFDLLTEEEASIYKNRFDIDLLTERLLKATKWVKNHKDTKYLPIGYFGASTGAASALCAAVKLPKTVKAIVSRGGRADMALGILDSLTVPTLLLVGSRDEVVIELNQKAQADIQGLCELKIINGATHLFTEPGKLEEVAEQTIEWFDTYLHD